MPLTDDQQAELTILKLSTADTHKFVVGLASPREPRLRFALERLQIRDWIRLIDVDVVSAHPGKLFRVFMLTEPAILWLDQQNNTQH